MRRVAAQCSGPFLLIRAHTNCSSSDQSAAPRRVRAAIPSSFSLGSSSTSCVLHVAALSMPHYHASHYVCILMPQPRTNAWPICRPRWSKTWCSYHFPARATLTWPHTLHFPLLRTSTAPRSALLLPVCVLAQASAMPPPPPPAALITCSRELSCGSNYAPAETATDRRTEQLTHSLTD